MSLHGTTQVERARSFLVLGVFLVLSLDLTAVSRTGSEFYGTKLAVVSSSLLGMSLRPTIF